MKLAVIYEDDNLLIVDKPAGILSHRADGFAGGDLLSWLKNPEYGVITRLDYQTCGLLVIGKNKTALTSLNKMQRQNQIRKIYYAVVSGYLAEPEALIRRYLLKDEKSAVVRMSQTKFPKAVETLTKYKVLEECASLSLIEIELITGRTHQIRAVMAHLGHPVAGDPLYGNPAINRRLNLKTQALAAMRLEFSVADNSDPLAYLDKKVFVKPQFPFMELMKKR